MRATGSCWWRTVNSACCLSDYTAAMSSIETLMMRAERLLDKLDALVPQPPRAPDWQASVAFRYRRRGD